MDARAGGQQGGPRHTRESKWRVARAVVFRCSAGRRRIQSIGGGEGGVASPFDKKCGEIAYLFYHTSQKSHMHILYIYCLHCSIDLKWMKWVNSSKRKRKGKLTHRSNSKMKLFDNSSNIKLWPNRKWWELL